MTPQEMMGKKRKLDNDILLSLSELINKFTSETGLSVPSLHVEFIESQVVGGATSHTLSKVTTGISID